VTVILGLELNSTGGARNQEMCRGRKKNGEKRKKNIAGRRREKRYVRERGEQDKRRK